MGPVSVGRDLIATPACARESEICTSIGAVGRGQLGWGLAQGIWDCLQSQVEGRSGFMVRIERACGWSTRKNPARLVM